jgi:hypothetical protein
VRLFGRRAWAVVHAGPVVSVAGTVQVDAAGLDARCQARPGQAIGSRTARAAALSRARADLRVTPVNGLAAAAVSGATLIAAYTPPGHGW